MVIASPWTSLTQFSFSQLLFLQGRRSPASSERCWPSRGLVHIDSPTTVGGKSRGSEVEGLPLLCELQDSQGYVRSCFRQTKRYWTEKPECSILSVGKGTPVLISLFMAWWHLLSYFCSSHLSQRDVHMLESSSYEGWRANPALRMLSVLPELPCQMAHSHSCLTPSPGHLPVFTRTNSHRDTYTQFL